METLALGVIADTDRLGLPRPVQESRRVLAMELALAHQRTGVTARVDEVDQIARLSIVPRVKAGFRFPLPTIRLTPMQFAATWAFATARLASASALLDSKVLLANT